MKLYIVIAGALISGTLMSQDVINLKNKTSIKAKVLNVGVKTISYKKYDNLEGPSYEVRNREVTNILYENGSQEVIKTVAQDYNESKNVISFNYGDLTVSRVGISYERLFVKSKLGIKIPISAAFVNNYYSNNAKMQTGLDVNYYPLGQKTVSFYTGLSTRIGKINQNYYYYNYYEPHYSSYYYPAESNFISAYVNNGLVVHFNDHFSISGQVGVGLRNIYQNYQSTTPHVNGELNASFRF
ncbi:MAG: hypothetical protein N4A35_17865 [Flavobacteriales bacterium]|jgi:hypothetical protein|nr:hypothetical protein [Flavobacteriales bacterium]